MINTIYCSIIICTRNRADSLKKTISSVLLQQYDDSKLEIIVVDNGSTDNTKLIVESCGSRTNYPIIYVTEPKIGLSYARNCGVKHARGEIVVFIDDDALPQQSKWIQRLTSAYTDPLVGAAGGDLVPIWPEGVRPAWIHDLLMYSLGLTQFKYNELAETHYPLYPWGANTSFRKESIQRLGGFSPRLGRIGNDQLSGEETELCLRLEQAGEKIVYVPDAVVVHAITQEQLTVKSFKRYAIGQGISEARIEVVNFSKFRLGLEIIRRFALLVVCFGGTIVFSAMRSPKLVLLCNFKLRSAWFYVFTILGLRSFFLDEYFNKL